MSFIDITTYTNLSQFGVLSLTSQTVNTTSGIISLINGNYGNPLGNYAGSGNFTTSGFPSGVNTSGATSAQSDLSQLILDIDAKTATLPTTITLIATPGSYTFLPNVNYINTPTIGITFNAAEILTFDAGNNPDAQFFITSTDAAMTFNSATFNLINGARACNIFWKATSLTGAITSTNTGISGIILVSTAFTVTNNAAGSIDFNGHIYSQGTVTFTRSGAGELNVNSTTCSQIVCYLKGTLILTKQGFVPIENIKAGHQVITKGKIYKNKFINKEDQPQLEPVVWVSKFKVFNLNSKSRPICIKKDALGENRPFQDLYVSPGHSLLLNGRMVLAKNIVNGITICQNKEIDNIEYYHLECEQHSAIFANGVLAESYLDVNNRDVFENSIRLRRKNNLKKLNFLSK